MKILSQIDVITNSSTEVFIIKGDYREFSSFECSTYFTRTLEDVVDFFLSENGYIIEECFELELDPLLIPPKPLDIPSLDAYISIIVGDLGFSEKDAIETRKARLEQYRIERKEYHSKLEEIKPLKDALGYTIIELLIDDSSEFIEYLEKNKIPYKYYYL